MVFPLIFTSFLPDLSVLVGVAIIDMSSDPFLLFELSKLFLLKSEKSPNTAGRAGINATHEMEKEVVF